MNLASLTRVLHLAPFWLCQASVNQWLAAEQILADLGQDEVIVPEILLS